MKSVAARGIASSNRASYGGAGLCSLEAGVGVRHRETEQGGERRTEPEEDSSRLGVEVRRPGCEEEEDDEGCGVFDLTSGNRNRKFKKVFLK